MAIKTFFKLLVRHTTPAEHADPQDKTLIPQSCSRQQCTLVQARDLVMGNCQSYFGAVFFSPHKTRLPRNGIAQTSSLEGLIPENERMEPCPKLSDLEEEIRKELRSLTKQSSDRKNSQIILPEDLAKFWSPVYKRQFYTRQSWYNPQWDHNDDMLKFQKIISILILIRFRDWGNFRSIFIDKQRTDNHLIFTLEELLREDFLGQDFAPDFWENQWIFCPLVIEERQEPYELTKDQAERRFPFIEPGEEIGSGATGIVFKHMIAARHLKYTTPGRESDNIKVKAVACKCVVEKTVETVEFDNLKSLRGFLSMHNRIMVNIATIIRDSPNTGRVHFILYDLAAYDLKRLLNERPNNHDEEHRTRHDTSSVGRNNSHDWWAGDLIRESQNLADALHFLHCSLFNNNNWSLVHNDLKPENILVFYPDLENEKFPVGQWKIADFGLSKIKENQVKQPAKCAPNSPRLLIPESNKLGVDVTHRQNRSISPRPVSITTAKRDPGRYTAPEIEGEGKNQLNPKSGDVWALGCIFSEVLAYAVAPPLVAELREECEKPRGVDQRFYDVDTKRAKETVMAWLKDLPDRCEVYPDPTVLGQRIPPLWVDGCVKLIERTLVVVPKDRCNAGYIRDELSRIWKQMKRDEKFTLLDRKGLASSSTGVRDVQIERSRSTLSGDEPLESPKSMEQPPLTYITEVTHRQSEIEVK